MTIEPASLQGLLDLHDLLLAQVFALSVEFLFDVDDCRLLGDGGERCQRENHANGEGSIKIGHVILLWRVKMSR